MMKLDFEKTCLAPVKNINKSTKLLQGSVKELQAVAASSGYEEPESSIQLPKDLAMRQQVKDLVNNLDTEKLKYVVVAGIGGSNLGAQAVYEAMFSQFDYLNIERQPKLLFLDTVCPIKIKIAARVLSQLNQAAEFIIVVISKSGTTVETIANFEVLIDAIKDKFADWPQRTICITGRGSKLWQQAEKFGLAKIAVPEQVGGRYSVFSPVGLLPLYLAGIDIDALAIGAQQAVDNSVQEDVMKNQPLLSAILTYWHSQNGSCMHNSFFFHPELESVGKWYRQLMGESLGKLKDLKGKIVRRGLTPLVSIGTTDLHSMAQLYFGGPRDKFTNLIYCLKTVKSKNSAVPEPVVFQGLAPMIPGKAFSMINKAIIGGVKAAYEKNKMPYLSIELEELSARSLGYYMQFRMIEIMYLARLMNINPFDQPNVEDYKIVAKKLLS